MKCVDKFVVSAGAEITYETILAEPNLKSLSTVERGNIATQSRSEMKTCLATNQKNNIRSKNGMIDLDSCKEKITSKLTKQVATASLSQTLLETFPDSPSKPANRTLREKITEENTLILERCLSARPSNQCTDEFKRNSTAAILMAKVRETAKDTLKNEIPFELRGYEQSFETCNKTAKEVDSCAITFLAAATKLLASKSLSALNSNLDLAGIQKELNACVDNIPEKQFGQNYLDQIQACSNQIYIHAAPLILENEVHSFAKTLLTEAQEKPIIEKLIKHDFSLCLSSNPTDQRKNTCIMLTMKNMGKELAKILLPIRFDDAFADKGLAGYKITPTIRKSFIETTLLTTNLCIDSKVNSAEPGILSQQLNSCFKDSIRVLASFIAKTQLSANLGESDKEKKIIADFQGDFARCLDESDGASVDIDAFTKATTTCSNKMASTYTKKIATISLQRTIEEKLPQTSDMSAEDITRLNSMREIVSKKLGTIFDVCISKSGATDPCVEELKAEGTKEIAVASGRLAAFQAMHTDQVPTVLLEVEANLRKCIDAKIDSDACVIDYSKNTTIKIGSLVVDLSLADALGKKSYTAAKKEIDALKERFTSCINNIKRNRPDEAFERDSKRCRDDLQNGAVALLQSQIKDWIGRPNDSPNAKMLKERISFTIPCLDKVLPSSPLEEKALQNIDSEGMLENITKLLGNMIDDDLEGAGLDLDAVLKSLVEDMHNAIKTDTIRKKLVANLVDKHLLDKLMITIVRNNVAEGLAKLAPQDRLPPLLFDQLVARKNIASIFSGATMDRIRPIIAKQLIEPMLVQGKSMKSPELEAANHLLKVKAVEELVNAPTFGDLIVRNAIQSSIQKTINGLEIKKRIVATIILDSDWEKYRHSNKGIEAETYIKQNLMMPEFSGEEVPPQEKANRKAKAEKLVFAALCDDILLNLACKAIKR